MKQFDAAWGKAVGNSEKILALIDKGDAKGSMEFFLGEDRKAFEELKKPLMDDILFNETSGKKAADHGAATYSSARWMTIIALIATSLLGVAASFAIITGVASPIRRTIDVVNRLASGDRAIVVADAERGDEVGTLARALRVFKDNMIQAEAAAAAQERDRQSREKRTLVLEQLVSAFESKVALMVRSLAGAATEMQSTSNAMAASAEQTNQRSGAVSAAAEQTSANVQTVASATEELFSSVHEIGQQVTTSRDIAVRALSESRDTATTVRLLSESTQRIGAVVQLISSIAAQTNLLALNATIEAARAGEAGKGFAVVASEVKSLANQTAKATGDIDGQISEVQDLTAKTVAAIEHIGRTINEMSEIAIAISAAIEEQAAATQEIARSASEAARGTDEVKSSIGSVREATVATGAAAKQIQASSMDLSRQAEDLNVQVGDFIAGVKAA
jgi:methyl-accepting chemotaxis protein